MFLSFWSGGVKGNKPDWIIEESNAEPPALISSDVYCSYALSKQFVQQACKSTFQEVGRCCVMSCLAEWTTLVSAEAAH